MTMLQHCSCQSINKSLVFTLSLCFLPYMAIKTGLSYISHINLFHAKFSIFLFLRCFGPLKHFILLWKTNRNQWKLRLCLHETSFWPKMKLALRHSFKRLENQNETHFSSLKLLHYKIKFISGEKKPYVNSLLEKLDFQRKNNLAL